MGDDGSSIPPHDDGGGWKSLSCGSQGTPRAEQEGDRAGLKGWRWGPLGKGTQLRQGQVVGREDSNGGGRDRNRQRQKRAV